MHLLLLWGHRNGDHLSARPWREYLVLFGLQGKRRRPRTYFLLRSNTSDKRRETFMDESEAFIAWLGTYNLPTRSVATLADLSDGVPLFDVLSVM